MEIEAKFRVAEAELPRIAALRRVGAFQLNPVPAPELQQNTYYDTADSRLAAARYGLRIRRVGRRSLVTLKGPAEVGADSVHRRAEFEFPGSNPDPTSWPQGVARDLALALTGGAALFPTVVISTERQVLHAGRHGILLAEICLDRGIMHVAGVERSFVEVEVELLADGSSADLQELIAALGDHVHLSPEPLSKLQRALALRQSAVR